MSKLRSFLSENLPKLYYQTKLSDLLIPKLLGTNYSYLFHYRFGFAVIKCSFGLIILHSFLMSY